MDIRKVGRQLSTFEGTTGWVRLKLRLPDTQRGSRKRQGGGGGGGGGWGGENRNPGP